jgi:SAM-dependent methyltransferase
VLATDISLECIAIASENPYENIQYKKADLTSPALKFPLADFGLCCNVAILPDPHDNLKIIRNVYKNLRSGGHALFVIPSLDSILFYAWRLIDWYGREGISVEEIPGSEFNYFKGPKHNIFSGIIDIRGVRTKHYSHPEIEVIFSEVGFEVTNIERLEYDWKTEFSSPPEWMKRPYPWDWMVEVRK